MPAVVQCSSDYLGSKMKFASPKAHAVPLQIPFLTLLMLALAASTLLVLKHDAPQARPAFAAASDAPTSRATPYGSAAALRNLLF